MNDSSAGSAADISQTLKVGDLSPGAKKFNLLFELIEVCSHSNQGLFCRVIDDTGICNACFSHYSSRLERGGVYYMTDLKCKVVANHLEIQMSATTSVTKEADRLAFRDKSNDVSAKYYAKRQELEDICQLDAGQLIPYSKQQAEEQIRQKKKFDQRMKDTKSNWIQRKQSQRHTTGKKETDSPVDRKRGVGDTGAKKNNAQVEVRKNVQKVRFRQKKPEEDWESSVKIRYQEKHKNMEYKPKPEPRAKQSKSVMYKEKMVQGGAGTLESLIKNGEWEYQRPKFVEKKENLGEYMELISVVAYVGSHVNLRVMICVAQRNRSESGYEIMVADRTGSVWLKIYKLNLSCGQWFEIDNLEVVREDGRLLIKETEFSEARQIDQALPINLKTISSK